MASGTKEEVNKTGKSGNRVTILDGYRALAILAVLAFHYTIRWAPPYDPSAHFPAGRIFNGFVPFEYGWFGVEFFFVISGFVILMTLERCRNVGDFACRRFARLWPPLFVAATLTTIIMFLIGPTDWLVSKYDYVTSILLIDSSITSRLLDHPGIKWVDSAYWSLWVEIRFYLLAAVVYLAVRRNFIKFWLAVQMIVSAAALLHNGKVDTLLELVCFPAYLPYFTLGVCIYEIYSKGTLHKLAVAGAVMAACLILYSAVLSLNIYKGMDATVCTVANLIIFFLFFLFVIDHPLVSIFKFRPIVALGQASYSLYLIHQNIGVSVMRTCVEWGIPYLIVLPLMVGAIIGAALLLFRYVEVPAKTWILRRSQDLIVSIEYHMPWLSYNLTHTKK